ncbi:MAG: arsenate reductase ArsC [Burkholderiales bacterium]|jgi:arsenate reductase
MSQKVFNVLFICSGNTARSIIAEALLNQLGKGRFKAYSAGSFPKGTVNPNALKVLEKLNVAVEGARSKSWSEFASADAPALDFVFTVCDTAAGEPCPAWPGQPMTAHWGIEDPVAATGTPEEVLRKFMDTAVVLRRRIELFASLPVAKLDAIGLKKELDAIGKQ